MIIRGIIDMARSLDVAVVAEGVETVGQAAWLAEAGCRVVQGYLFSRPAPADLINSWLRERNRPGSAGDPAVTSASIVTRSA
jgi:EAL domain-containing protein (putative c-di-GMP-specific phosphodiesterase class I)